MKKKITECYEDLAIAICKQAAIDYLLADQDYRETGYRDGILDEVESFFKSPWGRLLSFGQGTKIFERLKGSRGVEWDFSFLFRDDSPWA